MKDEHDKTTLEIAQVNDATAQPNAALVPQGHGCASGKGAYGAGLSAAARTDYLPACLDGGGGMGRFSSADSCPALRWSAGRYTA